MLLDAWYFAVMKFNFADLLVKKAWPFTKKKSTLKWTDLWCSAMGNGNGIFSILLVVGLSRVI